VLGDSQMNGSFALNQPRTVSTGGAGLTDYVPIAVAGAIGISLIFQLFISLELV